jgi:hypothetical protein
MERMFTDKEIEFIKNNFHRLTNKEISIHLGKKLWQVRQQCHSIGLKRMELEYWTKAQVNYLLAHYKQIGDKEIAQIFNAKWPKKKGWTLKHIEKKRKYLKLKRTKAQLKRIRERNRQGGCWKIGNVNMWKTRGVAAIGAVKHWDRYSYIKTSNGYVSLMRYTWEQHYGKIPDGYNVVRRNLKADASDINNLELITDAELGRRNGITRYPLEVRRAIISLNKLKKSIHGH